MAQTIEQLMELGLSKAEAERVINRNTKEAEKKAAAVERAEKRLPKAQAELDHASDRAAHWKAVAEKAGEKVAKYTAIIAGEDVELPIEESEPSEAQQLADAEAEAPVEDKPAAKKSSSRKR